VATSTLPFRRVLCGIDFSAPSTTALQYAFSLAKESNATLTLLHVIEYPPEGDALNTLPFDMAGYRAAVRLDATERMVTLITQDVRAWCEPETKLVYGKPYEQILATAADARTDLIVLGVHGRNAMDMMLFGSTTNQVIRRATCPVLTLTS